MDVRSLTLRVILPAVFVMGAAASARAQAIEATTLEAVLAEQKAAMVTSDVKPLRLALTTSFVALQGLDTFTTLHGLHSGKAMEANPFVGGVAQNPAAFIAVKGGLTAATVFSMNALAKRHPKGAIFAMLALNAGSAFIVKSNFSLTMTK